MKHKWQHPTLADSPSTGKRYWRSPAEAKGDAAFKKSLSTEFVAQESGAADTLSEEEQEASRRDFMKLMGAATSLAGLGVSSCRRPEKYLVAYNKAVEWVIPGKPTFYASTYLSETGAVPLVVTTHEGRPTHLQGNPQHPDSNGSLDSRATASILDLYNPNRQREFARSERGSLRMVKAADFRAKIAEVRAAARDNRGQGLAILLDPISLSSPTLSDALSEMSQKFPGLRLFGYSPISYPGRDEVSKSYLGEGKAFSPVLNKARRILSLGSDFLGLEAHNAKSVSEFMKGRQVDISSKLRDDMNRLYVVENRYTLTGGMADHRLPMKASRIPALAFLLGTEIASRTGHNGLRRLLKSAKIINDPQQADYSA